MNKKTLLFLAVLVAVLLVLARQRRREARDLGFATFDHELVPGFDPTAVQAMRVDHLLRSSQVELERDQRGVWFLTDPVAYPAEPGLVRHLLETLALCRGLAEFDPDLEAEGLDPPHIVLELTLADGDRSVTHRIEIGSVDVDASRVFVRVPGHPDAPPGSQALVLRVPRPLFTALDRNDVDFRDPAITNLRPGRIVYLRRGGTVVLPEEGGSVDLRLEARREQDHWRRKDPPRAELHPQAMGLLARGVADLRAVAFPADRPPSLEPFGLDQPAFWIEAEDEAGAHVELSFGFHPAYAEDAFLDRRWYAKRSDGAAVFEVDAAAARTLAQPTRLFLDDQILRALRDDVLRVELEGAGRRLVLSKEEQRWWVETAGTGRFPADPGAVEDVLARLEKARVGEFPEDLVFTPADPPRSVRILTRDGSRWGGEVGAVAREGGLEGVCYRRYGDEVVGIAEEELAELCLLSLDSLRDRVVLAVGERDVQTLWIESGEARLTFVHADEHWFPAGETVKVSNRIAILLDELLHVRATDWLPGAATSAAPLSDRVRVRVRLRDGSERSYVLGRAPDGTIECRLDGARAVLAPDSGASRLDGARGLFD